MGTLYHVLNNKAKEVKMEWREEVESALLKENVDILVKEARQGRIEKHMLKDMALQMGGLVHGVFVANKEREDISYILRCMLDKWYNEELCGPEVNGISKLIEILKDLGLNGMAKKMKQHPSGTLDDNTDMENTPGDTRDGRSDRPDSSSNADKTSFQKLKDRVGDDNVKTLLSAVNVGNFTKEQVEDFTENLHPKVKGEFTRANMQVNFVFNQKKMKTILTNWYEKDAFKLTKKQAINKLKAALEESDKPDIAFELKLD